MSRMQPMRTRHSDVGLSTPGRKMDTENQQEIMNR
jgi:hypothetical protein